MELITFEGSKTLETDSMGALVTVESNASHLPWASHSNIANVSSTINENPNVSEGISCALSVNPSLDIANEQQIDPYLSKLIDMKKCGVMNAPTAKVQDPILKTWYSHYSRLFLRDGLVVKGNFPLQSLCPRGRSVHCF